MQFANAPVQLLLHQYLLLYHKTSDYKRVIRYKFRTSIGMQVLYMLLYMTGHRSDIHQLGCPVDVLSAVGFIIMIYYM